MAKELPSWNNLYPSWMFLRFRTALKFKYWKTDHVEKYFKVFEEFQRSLCLLKAGAFKFCEHLTFEEHKEVNIPPYNTCLYSQLFPSQRHLNLTLPFFIQNNHFSHWRNVEVERIAYGGGWWPSQDHRVQRDERRRLEPGRRRRQRQFVPLDTTFARRFILTEKSNILFLTSGYQKAATRWLMQEGLLPQVYSRVIRQEHCTLVCREREGNGSMRRMFRGTGDWWGLRYSNRREDQTQELSFPS